MKLNWQTVQGSSRIVAEAYIPEKHTIVVRFADGVEWAYTHCPQKVWEEFTKPSQSRGEYISTVLDSHPNHAW